MNTSTPALPSNEKPIGEEVDRSVRTGARVGVGAWAQLLF
jgi:hypothetical protein